MTLKIDSKYESKKHSFLLVLPLFMLMFIFAEVKEIVLSLFYQIPYQLPHLNNSYLYRYDRGTAATYINDGGNDMYDGGNRVRNSNKLTKML